MQQLSLFNQAFPATVHQGPDEHWQQPLIALTSEIGDLLAKNVPVAIGISGGKDGSVAAWQTLRFLDQISHSGPRILIHADLGRAEWKDSAQICEQLASYCNTELVVVRRESGDMVDRWLSRWDANVTRYTQLQCVKLILPWSTASMRFCTSELKSAVIARYLTNRFRNTPIISVTGIRRQESAARAKKPISALNTRLTNKSRGTSGHDWNPIIDFTANDVWAIHHQQHLPIHPAYRVYGTSRVSCGFCIMSSEADLKASALCSDNHALLSELVDLEITSAYSFQSDRWLADVRPDVLNPAQRRGIVEAKKVAQEREKLERQIPSHLLFSDGWPDCVPSHSEEALLASVRRQVGDLMGFSMNFIDTDSIRDRYEHLVLLAQLARTRKEKREARAASRIMNVQEPTDYIIPKKISLKQPASSVAMALF